MSRVTYRYLEFVPRGLERTWASASKAAGEEVRLYGPWPRQTSWIGSTSRCFVYLADGSRGRKRIALEAARLRWATGQGIPAPGVLEMDRRARWLLTERVPDDPPHGPGYVETAFQTARAVAEAEPPQPRLLAGGRSRRAPRTGLPLRVARLVLGSVDLQEFVRVRRAARELPADTLAHGDFHSGNVLYDAGAGVARVTDMELLGWAPRWADQLTLWTGLDQPEDRDTVLAAVLSAADPKDLPAVALLHRWIALRTLAEMLVDPPRVRDPNRVAEAADRAAEARRNAAAWTQGTPHRSPP